MNLYNEIEPYAAAWTRNLITAGHVAPGVVDERSITDLSATDVTGPGQRHFFAGIGGWSRALRLAGVPDDADIWTGSCPCQPFSAAGGRRGFDDERHLWPAWFKLIDQCRPPIVLGEQVASPDGLRWLDAVSADLEGAGYAVGAADLCAAGVGAPHRRQRLWFVAYANHDGLDRLSATWLRRRREAEVRAATAARDPDGSQRDDPDGRREDGRLADADMRRRLATVDTGERGPRDRTQQPAGSRPSGELADAGSRGLEFIGGSPGDRNAVSTESHVDQRSAHDELVHAAQERRARRAPTDDATRDRRAPDRGEARVLGDSGRDGAWKHPGELPGDEGEHEIGSAHRDHASIATGATHALADSADGQLPLAERRPERRDGHGSDGAVHRHAADHSYWRDADWLPCRDGKWRPVEPGAFPLAHGIPGRVGRLRAYGNAIVPQVAAAFVTAALDSIGGLS